MLKKLQTGSRKIPFHYEGDISKGITIFFGSGGKQILDQTQCEKLLKHFKGKTVPVGTSRDNPPPYSLGEWLMSNVTKTAIASYVAPILVEEGYAKWVGTKEISFYIAN